MEAKRIFGLCIILVTAIAAPCAAQAAEQAPRCWEPVADDVYLQEIADKLPTAQPVTAVAAFDGTVYAVSGETMSIVRDGGLQDAPGAPAGIHRLRVLDSTLWAATDTGAYRFADGAWQRIDERPYVDFCIHLDAVHGATRDAVFRFENGQFVEAEPENGYLSSDSTVVMEDFSQVLADPVRIGPIDRIASYSGTLYLLRPGELALIDIDTFVPSPIDWGTMPSQNTRDMLVQGSQLYITTDRGVAVVRGMALTTLLGNDGLPYEDTTCLAEGFDGDLWIGTTRGAIRKTGAISTISAPTIGFPGTTCTTLPWPARRYTLPRMPAWALSAMNRTPSRKRPRFSSVRSRSGATNASGLCIPCTGAAMRKAGCARSATTTAATPPTILPPWRLSMPPQAMNRRVKRPLTLSRP